MSDSGKIRCLVVDDEPPALEVLKTHIAAVAAFELVALCNNAVEALQVLQQRRIDLLFLDIQMPHILGTDFVRTLKNPPRVIFTTAYRKFAIEGFELDAVDYLLKPISFERFLKAVNKVLQLQIGVETAQQPHSGTRVDANNAIYFRSDRKMIKVDMDDILYVESLKDYVKVVAKNRTIVTKHSISSLEENLPKSHFIRIHRSFIVALNKIDSFTNEIVEIGKQELPISRMYRHEVDRAFQNRKGNS